MISEADRKLAALHPRRRLDADRARLGVLKTRLEATATRVLASREKLLGAVAARLDAMSPLRVLQRGYAIARTPDGVVVSSTTQVAPGDALQIRVADGEIATTVKAGKPQP